jgi:hypothetical protein
VPAIIDMNREEAKFQLTMPGAFERPDGQTYAALAKYLSDFKKATGADALRALATSPEPPPVYGYLMSWGARDAYGRSAAPEPIAIRIGACPASTSPSSSGTSSIRGGSGSSAQAPPTRTWRPTSALRPMMRYTAQFARTGDPNPPGSDLPAWKSCAKEPASVCARALDFRDLLQPRTPARASWKGSRERSRACCSGRPLRAAEGTAHATPREPSAPSPIQSRLVPLHVCPVGKAGAE